MRSQMPTRLISASMKTMNLKFKTLRTTMSTLEATPSLTRAVTNRPLTTRALLAWCSTSYSLGAVTLLSLIARLASLVTAFSLSSCAFLTVRNSSFGLGQLKFRSSARLHWWTLQISRRPKVLKNCTWSSTTTTWKSSSSCACSRWSMLRELDPPRCRRSSARNSRPRCSTWPFTRSTCESASWEFHDLQSKNCVT